MSGADTYIPALAQLAVRVGANVQPGQIVAISSEPGREPLARAIAEAAYEAGAKFVDLWVFDPYFKRARALYADPDTLSYAPPWMGERLLALGEHHAARIALTGPTAPRALEGIDPALIALDQLPRLPETMKLINDRTTNWTVVPCPNPAWATLVHPRLDPPAALERLWSEIAHVCRIDEPDPPAAWAERVGQLSRAATALDELSLDALRLEGPGTDLTIGLLPSSRWIAADFETVDGVHSLPNLPTEEVFTTPDPERVDGTVAATKPLSVAGTTITDLRVTFAGGRVVDVQAREGAEVLRGMIAIDDGAARLGEVALVDREGRIGPLGTVFYDTLLDENAASHLALGHGYLQGVASPDEHERVNRSKIHTDFMVGSNEVAVTGIRGDSSEVALLRDGSWQI